MDDDDDELMDNTGFEKHLDVLTIKQEKRPSPNAQRASKQPQPQPQPKQLPPVVNPPPKKQAVGKKPVSKDQAMLIERHHLFKEAALKAKHEGNTNSALIYLRHAKVNI